MTDLNKKLKTIPSRRMSAQAVSGFTLIEVLVALVVMSVGMLGITGLYVTSMQAGRTSLFHHHAVTLAGDIADRIRANPRATFLYAGVGADNNCAPPVAVDCTPAEMAAHDIFQWDQQAVDTLPTGTVTIVFNNGVAPPTYQITVAWNEPGELPPPSYVITSPFCGN